MKRTHTMVKAWSHRARGLARGARAAALVVAVGSACAQGENGGDRVAELPDRLASLALVESHAGAGAAAMIARLHGRAVAPRRSIIGLYGPERMRIALFVSRFDSEAQADSQLRLMARRIDDGVAGYGHYRSFEAAGTRVHVTFSQDAVHYFFSDGVDLLWVMAPPALARAAVAQLLEVDSDSLPGLIQQEH